MFEGFAHVWTPVAMSSELRADRPLARTVAGTPVVLFRGRDGSPAALLDRCPHRGVALSLGKVKDGCVECPFHGWTLTPAGDVCHVPWNPDAKLDTLTGVAFPVLERAGQVWLYTATEAPSQSEPEVHESLLRADVRVSGQVVVWNTHWTRAMENMLDWPHLPFIHAGTIGRDMKRQSGARMDIDWEPTAWGAHTRIQIDGVAQPGALDFRWPNQMNLFLPLKGRTMIMQVACVPIDATRTRMLLMMARDFLRPAMFDWVFNRSNLKIALEDQAVVESSFPAEIPPAKDERSVRTDGPTLYFRKRYYAELSGSSVEAKGRRALPVVSGASDAS